MSEATGTVEHFLQQARWAAGTAPGAGTGWVDRIRSRGAERFAALGFPTPRQEDWKYTRTAPIEKRAFRVPESRPASVPEALANAAAVDLGGPRLVMVDGRASAELSRLEGLPAGARIQALADALAAAPDGIEPHLGALADAAAQPFTALNAAFMTDGVVLELGPGVHLDAPVHLVHVSTGAETDAMSHPRLLVLAGARARASIVETWTGVDDAVYFNNAVGEIVLAPGAQVSHYKVQCEGAKGLHVATLEVRQDADSRFASHSVSLGGSMVRNDINVRLEAEGTDCRLDGLFVASGRQHVDYHTRIDHAKPRGTSREHYKGILDGRARGVFNGRVLVHPDAQHTDAVQSSHNLLLSRDAEVDTKPQLEIYADDVKCAHGATVGQLDEDMIFYLRARGIPEATARGMLTYGFAREVVERVDIERLESWLEAELVARLPGGCHVKEAIR